MNQYEIFAALHQADSPVIIGNIWDVESARLLAESGFKAIATSSAALANALGYGDGEQLPVDLLLDTVKRIKAAISLPLSVDLEKGYSRSGLTGILDNIDRLLDIGVVGINIEDSTDEGNLQPEDHFTKTISGIAGHLAKRSGQLFINARTDAFLLKLPDAITVTEKRMKAYENAGASGLFVPFIKEEADIRQVVNASSLPVNVLSMPGLPSFIDLAELGVKRVSLGSSLYRCINRIITEKAKAILQNQSVDGLF